MIVRKEVICKCDKCGHTDKIYIYISGDLIEALE